MSVDAPTSMPGCCWSFGKRRLSSKASVQEFLTPGVCWPYLWIFVPTLDRCFSRWINLYFLWMGNSVTQSFIEATLHEAQHPHWFPDMLCCRLWPETTQKRISLQGLTNKSANKKKSSEERTDFRSRAPPSFPLWRTVPCWVHSCGGTCLRSWVCCCCCSAWPGDSCCCATLCSSLAIRAAPSCASRSWSSAGSTSRSWRRRTRMHSEGRREPPWLVMVSDHKVTNAGQRKERICF